MQGLSAPAGVLGAKPLAPPIYVAVEPTHHESPHNRPFESRLGNFSRVAARPRGADPGRRAQRPRSRFSHFNRGRLETALNSAGIAYRWLGEALGGRPADPALYPGGDAAPGVLPDYERVRETPAYREGLERLAVLIEDDPEGGVCVMCAEEDPGRCHRNWLIAPDLRARGIEVVHLRKAGKPEQMELV